MALTVLSVAVFALIGVAYMQASAIEKDRATLVEAHRDHSAALETLSQAKVTIRHFEDETTRLSREWEGSKVREQDAVASREKTQAELDQTKRRLYGALVDLEATKKELATAQSAARQDKAKIAELSATILKKESDIAGLSTELLSADSKPIGDLFGQFLTGIQRPPSAAGYVAEQKCAMGGQGPGCQDAPTVAPASSGSSTAGSATPLPPSVPTTASPPPRRDPPAPAPTAPTPIR